MENQTHKYSIDDVVFSEFEYNGLSSFFPVKIIGFAPDNSNGKNYFVRDQNGEKFRMFEDNLNKAEELAALIPNFVFCDEDSE